MSMPNNLVLYTAFFATSICQCAIGQDAANDLPDLGPIKRKLTELRGLDFKRDVPSEVQDIDDFGDMVSDEMDAMFPLEKRAGVVNGLLRLGMLTESIDFGDAFTDALKTQAAAYYDPESGTFYYLALDMPAMSMNSVAAHELVHALQDQHYDLKKLQDELETLGMAQPRDDDRILAARYLIEGEATYVQMLYQTPMLVGNPQGQEMMFRTMANMDTEDMIAMAAQQLEGLDEDDPMARAARSMAEIPPYILYPLNAAYTNGAFFVMRARGDGGDGWQGVADVYADLPGSTEQVMHPERYTTTRDHRTEIQLPPLQAITSAGATMVDSAIHGEFYLRLMLRQCGVSKPQAKKATEGWDGDVYAAFADDDDHTAIALATTWDTEDDAREFFEAYLLATDGKYESKTMLAGSAESGHVAFHCGDGLGMGYVALRGREVFAIEGCSQLAGSMAMIELLSMPIEHVK